MTNNILRPSPAVPSTQFTWDSPTRTFVAEISDLGPAFKFERVYNDSADLGFTVIGRRGEEIIVVIDHEEMQEGDVMFWTGSVISSPAHTAPARFKIFND